MSQTISRARQLDRVPPVQCPAAIRVAGAIPALEGVICGVIHNDLLREQGLDMSPAQLQVMRGESGAMVDPGGAYMTVKSDPKGIGRLCSGCELPVLGEREIPGNRAHYTYCPTLQAEKQRIWQGRGALAGGGLAKVAEEDAELLAYTQMRAREILGRQA